VPSADSDTDVQVNAIAPGGAFISAHDHEPDENAPIQIPLLELLPLLHNANLFPLVDDAIELQLCAVVGELSVHVHVEPTKTPVYTNCALVDIIPNFVPVESEQIDDQDVVLMIPVGN
jgi:hypothetical protein